MTRAGFLVVGSWAAVAVACGRFSGSAEPGDGIDGGTDVGTAPPSTATSTTTTAAPATAGSPAHPPALPAGAPATASKTTMTFAVDTIWYGETDRSGSSDANAWKGFGYDLDALVSTSSSSGLCTPVAPADAGVSAASEDGAGGRDNAFGHLIMPIFETLAPGSSRTETGSLHAGNHAILLSVTGLTSGAAQTNGGLSLTMLRGGPFGVVAPTFTATDDWPVFDVPKDVFADAYVVKGTFVVAPAAPLHLQLGFDGIALSFVIRRPTITFEHAALGKLANGTIAGVITTADLVAALKVAAVRIDTSLCASPTLDAVLENVRRASDMMADGSNGPGATCDGISIGIGFAASLVGNPTKVAEPSEPDPAPCGGS